MTMSDSAEQIAALERALAELPPGSPARAGLEAMLQQLRAAVPQPAPSGGVSSDRTRIDQMGDTVGGDKLERGDKVLGDKIVQRFFDGQPGEDGERLLRDYLVALLDANRTLRLSRMTEK